MLNGPVATDSGSDLVTVRGLNGLQKKKAALKKGGLK
jgi:hypothetical protein